MSAGEDITTDLAEIAAIAIAAVPGVGIPASVLAAVLTHAAPMIYRLAAGEDIDAIKAEPLREAHGVDRAALRARLEAAL